MAVDARSTRSSRSDDAFYRVALLQMQSEFTRAVDALEKQVACLTAHNELLETAQTQQRTEIAAREREQALARDAITALESELAMCREDVASKQAAMLAREETLAHECDALKQLLAHEQSYWTRFESAKTHEVASLHALVATARADAAQHQQQTERLARELQQLQSRVDAATRSSRHLEQRLALLSHEKRDAQLALDAHVRRLQRKVADKREQNRFLAEALASRDAELQRLRPHKTRIDAADELQSHAPTSPTASSPDLTPPTTPHMPTRKRSSSRRDQDATATKAAGATSRSHGSARLEREMSALRRKLDACMQLDPER